MEIHANARTCPNSRKLLVQRIEEEGWSLMAAAEAAGISERSTRKWLARWRAEGEAGLLDRSSAPRRVPSRTPERVIEAICALRRLRMTAAEIAEALGLALSTVSLWLKRRGLGKRSALAPPEPPNRYERSRPGELVHVDVKKLGRFGAAGKRQVSGRCSSRGYGWECCHVCVDDATRLAYVEVLPDERGETAVGFLQTMLREWAYGRLYGSSAERASQLPGWLERYNYRRKHGSLGHRPPAARLNELLGNNLVGNYT
jgi:transposase